MSELAKEFSNERTQRLIGLDGCEKIGRKHVVIAGVGGVGSYVAEALCRSGIGKITLVDPDVVDPTNLNRQLIALQSTIGRPKVEVMAERMRDINPSIEVVMKKEKLSPEGLAALPATHWDGIDYIADCIDDVKGKTALILAAREQNIPIISALGTGNQLDNQHYHISDISKTSHCPLAKALRLALRKEGLSKGVKVVYTTNPPYRKGSGAPGTISFVPGTSGLLLAGEIIRDFLV